MTWIFPLAEGSILLAAIGLPVAVAAIVAGRRGVAIGLGMTLWLIAVFLGARLGAFSGHYLGGRNLLGAVEAAPPIIAALTGLAGRFGPSVRQLSRSSLTALHGFRAIAGVLLLFAVVGRALTPWIGISAGIAEIVVAVWAVTMARAMADGKVRRLLPAWTALGTASAVFVMLIALVAGRNQAYFLTLYPLVFVPGYLLPVLLVGHGAVLWSAAGQRGRFSQIGSANPSASR